MSDPAASPAGHHRSDDLAALVQAVMRMPGFHGVRQQLDLLGIGREMWQRTHPKSAFFQWPDKLPYLDKSFTGYHAPEPLRLDVLVLALQHPGTGIIQR